MPAVRQIFSSRGQRQQHGHGGIIFFGSGTLSTVELRGFYPAFEASSGSVTLTAVTLTDNTEAVNLYGTANVSAQDVFITSGDLANGDGYLVSQQAQLNTIGGSISSRL